MYARILKLKISAKKKEESKTYIKIKYILFGSQYFTKKNYFLYLLTIIILDLKMIVHLPLKKFILIPAIYVCDSLIRALIKIHVKSISNRNFQCIHQPFSSTYTQSILCAKQIMQKRGSVRVHLNSKHHRTICAHGKYKYKS